MQPLGAAPAWRRAACCSEDAAYHATNEQFTEVADKNPIFKKLYESTSAFRNEQHAWHQVCEVTCDSYMVRKRSRT